MQKVEILVCECCRNNVHVDKRNANEDVEPSMIDEAKVGVEGDTLRD